MTEYLPVNQDAVDGLYQSDRQLNESFTSSKSGANLSAAFWRFVGVAIASGTITDEQLAKEAQTPAVGEIEDLDLQDKGWYRESAAISLYILNLRHPDLVNVSLVLIGMYRIAQGLEPHFEHLPYAQWAYDNRALIIQGITDNLETSAS